MKLWDWLNQITYEKKSWSSFTEDQQSSFNPYMVHRFVSMYNGYIDIANIAQKIPLTEKEKVYTIYKTLLPKKKMYLKYVKNQNQKNYKELAEYISDYFEVSLGEADEYIYILQEYGVRDILWKMGVNEDETEKLIKKAEL
jgi:hypothetical protein